MAKNDAQKMSLDELKDLYKQAEAIRLRDVHLGTFLHSLISHVAHAHGLDESQLEEEKARQEEQPGKEETAPQLKAVAPKGDVPDGN